MLSRFEFRARTFLDYVRKLGKGPRAVDSLCELTDKQLRDIGVDPDSVIRHDGGLFLQIPNDWYSRP